MQDPSPARIRRDYTVAHLREVAATYTRVKDVMTDLLGGPRADVFGANAARTYRLPVT